MAPDEDTEEEEEPEKEKKEDSVVRVRWGKGRVWERVGRRKGKERECMGSHNIMYHVHDTCVCVHSWV